MALTPEALDALHKKRVRWNNTPEIICNFKDVNPLASVFDSLYAIYKKSSPEEETTAGIDFGLSPVQTYFIGEVVSTMAYHINKHLSKINGAILLKDIKGEKKTDEKIAAAYIAGLNSVDSYLYGHPEPEIRPERSREKIIGFLQTLKPFANASGSRLDEESFSVLYEAMPENEISNFAEAIWKGQIIQNLVRFKPQTNKYFGPLSIKLADGVYTLVSRDLQDLSLYTSESPLKQLLQLIVKSKL